MKKLLLTILNVFFLFSLSLKSQDLVEVFPGFEGKGFGMLTWGDYDGDGDLDLITGGETNTTATKTHLYQNLGNGEFSLVENTGIPDLANGFFDFADYDGDGDDDLLAMGSGVPDSFTGLLISNGDGTFTNANAGLIDKVYLGTCNWIDYDIDGDLDIFISGFLDTDDPNYISRLYNNDGSGVFTLVENTGIQGVAYSRSVWADLDEDGDMDLYLQGLAWTGETDRATIYENNGDGTFSAILEFLPVWLGDAAWVDYDNDGDWDLMYSGFNTDSGARVTFLYKNTGTEFVQVADNIVGVSQTAFDWADYDLDGDLDLFIVGVKDIASEVTMVAYIYENQGDDIFVQSDYEFIGNWFGDAEWADYDNDGDPDLIYLGQEFSGTNAIHVYRNDSCLPSIGVDTITACDEFTWIDGVTYTESNNTAIFNIEGGAASGCDSLVTLNLTINSVDVSVQQDEATLMATETEAEYQWLDCNNDYSEITGEISQSFTATVNGDYAVEISKNGCTDTSSCYSVTIVGILENNTKVAVTIYPNPASDFITLSVSNRTFEKADILDVLGNIVWHQDKLITNRINIQNLNNGIYFLRLQVDGNVISKRFLKQ